MVNVVYVYTRGEGISHLVCIQIYFHIPKKITIFFGREGKGEGGDIEEGKNKKDKKGVGGGECVLHYFFT